MVFTISADYCSPIEEVAHGNLSSTTPVVVGAIEGDSYNISCITGYEYDGDGVCECSRGGVWTGSCDCASK